MFKYWKFKPQFCFVNKINTVSVLGITFLNLFISTSTSKAQFLLETTQLTERICYSENINAKLTANILEIHYI